jgi:hypothetical protein
MKKNNVLVSKYPSYKNIRDKLNQKVKDEAQAGAISKVYKVFSREQNISTLIDGLLAENPIVIVCHERLFPNLSLDERFRETSDIFAATKGIWGYLGQARVYCYNSDFIHAESRVLTYDRKRRLSSIARVLEG